MNKPIPPHSALPALPLRHVVWGLVSIVTPLFWIAVWLLMGGSAYPRAQLGGVLMLIALGLVPALLVVVYRGIVARERVALDQLDALRGHALASDERLAAIIASAMDAVIVTDASRHVVIFNQAAERLLGYTALDVVGQPLEMLMPERFRATHPGDMARFAATGESARRMGAGEVRARHADGHEIPVEVSISRTLAGENLFFMAILRDISGRKRTEAAMARSRRMYQALVRTGQAVARSRDQGELFRHVCEIAVAEGGLSGCWIGWIESMRMHPVAQYNIDPRYLDKLNITLDPDDPRSRGPSATAVRQGTPYICNDFAADPNTAPWQARAAEQGIRASAAIPLRREGVVVGALCVHAAEPGFFTPDLIELMEVMAHDVSFGLDALNERDLREEAEGIMRKGYEELGVRVRERTVELYEANERLQQEVAERTRAEVALRRSDARFNEAQRVGRVGSWELDLKSNDLAWSDEIYRIFEIDPEKFGASYEAFLNAIHPDDRELVNRAYIESVGNHIPYDIAHRLQMPDGRIKHVRERCSTFYDEDGVALRSIGTVQDVTEQMLAEIELRRTRDQLQAILDSTPDWIFIKDAGSRFLLVNKSFAGSMGLHPQDMIGRPDTDFWSPELCEGDPGRGIRGFHEDDRAAFRGEFVHNPYDPATDVDGELRIFDTLKGPLRDADGRIYGVLGYARDVTERSESEQQVRALNESLELRVAERTAELDAEKTFIQTVLDTQAVLVVVLDFNAKIVQFNQAGERLTHYRADEVLGKSVFDLFIPPEQRQEINGVFQDALARPGSYENEWLTREGKRLLISWTNNAIRDSEGEARYIVATGIDVTARRAAERALRENEQLLREVADNIHQVIFVRDVAEDRMIFVSPAYEKIWQRPRETLYANPRAFLEGVHPDDLDAVLEGLRRQAAEGRPFNQEYRVLRQDGERYVWVRTFPIVDDQGRVYRIAGLAEDVTERRVAEEVRLQHLRAQRDNLVREVHHRIKNNLQGVAGLLRNHISRAPAAREVLENVITQIHAVALVHGLQGRAGYDEVRMCDVVNAVCDAIVSLTGAEIRRDLPALRGDQCAHVAQDEAVPVSLIVNELIFNAVKHREAGTVVYVSVQLDAQLAHVRIINRGAPLATGFSLMSGKGLGTGLTLARSLLPPDTGSIEYDCEDGEIQTIFTLRAPTITVRT